MRYLSTRGEPAAPGLGFCDILLEGLAPDGGLFLPESYPRVGTGDLARWRSVLASEGYAGLAFAVLSLFIDDIPEADLRGICERAYHPAIFGGTGHRRRHRDRGRPVAGTPLRWPDGCVQGHGHAVAGPAVRVRTGAARQPAEHPGCDQRRHRLRGGVRDARAAPRPCVHADAGGADDPVPAGPDVQHRRSVDRQHRRGRRLRRLPGPGEGGRRRPGVQAAALAGRGELDQLGPAGGAGGLLRRGLAAGDHGRRPAGVVLPCRPGTSATSAPDTSPG